ncbi:MAG: hypothetical protein WCK53_16000 [Methanomicrobiales archaeon]
MKNVSIAPINAPPVAGTGTDTGGGDISPRTWILFYLICLVAILWATFLLAREEMVWVSIFRFLVSGGMVIFAYFLGDHHLVSGTGTSQDPGPIDNSGNPVPGPSEKNRKSRRPGGGIEVDRRLFWI